MTDKIILLSLFSGILLSCNNKGTEIIKREVNLSEDNKEIEHNLEITNIQEQSNIETQEEIIEISEFDPQEIKKLNFDEIIFVNSKEGLRQRAEPSLNSIIIGKLSHGTTIWVDEKSSFVETIDGITDYWYRTWGGYYNNDPKNRYTRSWVFGGYLSATLPLDIPAIVGYWDIVGDDGRYSHFTTDNMYSEGYRGSSFGLHGKWELIQDSLAISITSTGHEVFEEDEIDYIYIRLKIINRDNIIFIYQNGKSIELTRSRNFPTN